MSDVKPMLLMVCGACRGDVHDDLRYYCRTEGCIFYGSCRPRLPLKPARTREEMVEAMADAYDMRNAVLDERRTTVAERLLVATGVIEPREGDHA